MKSVRGYGDGKSSYENYFRNSARVEKILIEKHFCSEDGSGKETYTEDFFVREGFNNVFS